MPRVILDPPAVAPTPTSRRHDSRLARSTAVLALVLAAVGSAVLVLQAGGPAVTDLVQYVGFVLVFVTWPGVVAWRLLWTGDRGGLFEQAVLGTLVGFVVHTPVYLLGVLVGAPRLTVVLPVTALGVVVVARARGAGIGRGGDRAPGATPAILLWAIAVVTFYAVWWETRIGYAIVPRWAPGAADPTGDQQFQLALTHELRHHVPPTFASIDGQPLQYHYYVNAHLASASWWVRTPDWIVQDRLLLPLMVALVLSAVGIVTYRWTRSGWAGALAVVVLGLVGDFSPFRWSVLRSNFDERFLAYFDPISPSLQFSIALLLLMLHVATRVLRAERLVARDWVLFALVTAILPGAKGSAIAVAVGGILFVLVVSVVARLEGRGRVLAMTGVVVGVFVVSQVLMFRGAEAAMAVAPFDIVRYVSTVLGLSPDLNAPLPVAVSIYAGVGLVLSWTCAAAGALGLLHEGGWRDPTRLLPLGAGAAGIGAALTFGNPHLAQDYFARTSAAPLAVASATGVWWLLRRTDVRTRAVAVVGGLAVGLLTTLVAAMTAPREIPALVADRVDALVLVQLRPYLVVGAVVLVACAVGLLLVRRSRVTGPVVTAAVLCVVVGLGLARVPHTLGLDAVRVGPAAPATASIGRGGMAAAYWIRDHAALSDVVATNAHYLKPGGLDNRHFWIAALTERRVHLEGWGYTPRIGAVALREHTSSYEVPFWDPAELAANDRAFTDPGAVTLGSLRRAGVRWLLVDRRFAADVPALRRTADVRFQRGAYVVLDIDKAASPSS